jgi:hypothetical protein
LWIDSLCIIQDSHEDWEAEAAKMGDIYRRALFTISAAKSKDGNGGCFIDRDARFHRLCQLAMTFPDEDEDIRTFPDVEEEVGDEQVGWSNEVYVFPARWWKPVGRLYSRAWVLQEQALSVRNLAFASDTFYWSCVTYTASESRITGHKGHQAGSSKYRQSHFENLQETISRRHADNADSNNESCMDMEKFYESWGNLISDYGRRGLTFQTDRLVALAGVVSEVSYVIDNTYAAGLWSGDIFRGLLWACKGPRGWRHSPPQLYIAPSGSWASLNDTTITTDFANQVWKRTIERRMSLTSHEAGKTIKLDDDDLEEPKEDIEIEDIQCTPNGKNPFGQLSSDIIHLRVYLKKPVFVLPENTHTEDINADFHLPHTLHDFLTGEVVGGLSLDEVLGSSGIKTIVWCLFMTWLYSGGEIEDGGIEDGHATCLALVETGVGENEFRRIGFAQIYVDDWFNDVKKMLISLV